MFLKIKNFVESNYFQNFIIGLIVFNGFTMGLETSKTLSNNYDALFDGINLFVISIFTIEIALRIYVHKLNFFKDPWSIFDFVIVAISLIPAGEGFEILRVLRVLRLFRLITVVPQMKKVITALVSVVPGLGSIAILLGLIFYVFSIMATELFGEEFPKWFGTLGDSFYTLFQIMTLESWSMGIVRPVMEVYPHSWIFFVIFIFIATFIMINLIVAIVVDAMSNIVENEEEILSEEKKISDEIMSLKDEIRELKDIIKSK